MPTQVENALVQQNKRTKDIDTRVKRLEVKQSVNIVVNLVAPTITAPGMVWIQPSGIGGTPSTVWTRDPTDTFWN